MRTMRASAKWVMGILVFAFVGWMIFQVGMNVSGQSKSATLNAVGRVNGEKIPLQTYYTALRNQQEDMRNQPGGSPTSLSGQKALEDQVFNQLVQNVLLQQEYSRRGIKVTDQEIQDAANSSPPQEVMNLPQFQTDSQFDLAKYQRFIHSNADPQFQMALEARYREQIPQLKLFRELTASVFVSDFELWQRYRDEHDSVTIKLLPLLPSAVVPDSAVPVTRAQARSYYQAHQSDFDRPATAYMSYVSVSRVPSAADTAAALAHARALRRQILAGGDFAAIAKRESADSVSAAKGGDLGEARAGQFVPAFEHAALALKPGQISQPVLTPFGYHLIKLESKKGDTFHARHILIPIQLDPDHQREVESLADTLDLLAAEQERPGVLDSVAHQLRLTVRQAPPLEDGRQLRIGTNTVADASVWAFGTAEVGHTSPVIETPSAYYVFRMDSLTAKGVPAFAQIASEVTQMARYAAKKARTHTIATQIDSALRRGVSLDAVGARWGIRTMTLGPFTRAAPAGILQSTPSVVGVAFGLPVGKVSGPLETPSGTLFIQPLRRVKADSASFVAQKEQERQRAIQAARQARVQLVMTSIQDAAKIEDFRPELEQAQKAASQQQQTGVPQPNGRGF